MIETTYTKKELAECAYREVQMRRMVYPKWIARGKIKDTEANRQLLMMETISRLLMKVPDEWLKDAQKTP